MTMTEFNFESTLLRTILNPRQSSLVNVVGFGFKESG